MPAGSMPAGHIGRYSDYLLCDSEVYARHTGDSMYRWEWNLAWRSLEAVNFTEFQYINAKPVHSAIFGGIFQGLCAVPSAVNVLWFTHWGLTSGYVSAKILVPSSGETVRRMRKSVRDAIMVMISSITSQVSWWHSDCCGRGGMKNWRVCSNVFAIKSFEYGNHFLG